MNQYAPNELHARHLATVKRTNVYGRIARKYNRMFRFDCRGAIPFHGEAKQRISDTGCSGCQQVLRSVPIGRPSTLTLTSGSSVRIPSITVADRSMNTLQHPPAAAAAAVFICHSTTEGQKVATHLRPSIFPRAKSQTQRHQAIISDARHATMTSSNACHPRRSQLIRRSPCNRLHVQHLRSDGRLATTVHGRDIDDEPRAFCWPVAPTIDRQ